MATTVTLKPNAIDISGSTSGTTTLQATAVAGTTTITLPAATDTLVGKATTDTLTNKTLTAPTLASANITTALTLTGVSGTNGQALTSAGSGNAPTWTTIAASPGGSTTQLQYNNAGAFGGISGVTSDGTRMTASTTIGVGGATPSTSGSGISFPATQSASTDANTLDDYEEGTWSPVIGGSTSTSGQSYSIQVGRYTKIGRQVNISFQATLSNKGTMTGSFAVIQGLPFSAGTDSQTAGNICVYNNMNTGFTFMGFQASSSNSFAYLTGGTGTVANTSFLVPADINSSTQLIGSMTYFV